MAIQTVARTVLTAVGTREDFETEVSQYAGKQEAAELSLTRMVAFAFSHYHKGGEAKHWAINQIRDNVKLSKDAARRLDNALTRISRSKVEEGDTVAKAALRFGNEFCADFYGIETKLRLAKKEAAQEAAKKKAQDAKKTADDTLKQIKADAKKEAEESATVEVLEFTLIGEAGAVEVLTPDEYTALALTLSQMRMENKPALKVANG